jgi:hypothetical protein
MRVVASGGAIASSGERRRRRKRWQAAPSQARSLMSLGEQRRLYERQWLANDAQGY